MYSDHEEKYRKEVKKNNGNVTRGKNENEAEIRWACEVAYSNLKSVSVMILPIIKINCDRTIARQIVEKKMQDDNTKFHNCLFINYS